MGFTALLVLFMGPTVLFQLIFTFVFSTFSKKFLIQQNKWDPKRNLRIGNKYSSQGMQSTLTRIHSHFPA